MQCQNHWPLCLALLSARATWMAMGLLAWIEGQRSQMTHTSLHQERHVSGLLGLTNLRKVIQQGSDNVVAWVVPAPLVGELWPAEEVQAQSLRPKNQTDCDSLVDTPTPMVEVAWPWLLPLQQDLLAALCYVVWCFGWVHPQVCVQAAQKQQVQVARIVCQASHPVQID